MGEQAKANDYVHTERYTGNWNGKRISFKRQFSTHRFTDEECEKLLAGEEIVIDDLVSKKTGKTYAIHGKLEQQNYQGRDYVGFKNLGLASKDYQTKAKNKTAATKKSDTSEKDTSHSGSDKDRQDTSKTSFFAPGASSFAYHRDTNANDRMSAKREGLADMCRDMGVDESEFDAEPVRFTGNSAGIGSKVKHAVGTVAKGTAVAAGVGVLGLMAGTTALAAKGNRMKDELTVSFGESMSYSLARLLGGNDHMLVQRFQQAGMKGVEMVSGEKAIRKVARPLPTINMPVPQEDGMVY